MNKRHFFQLIFIGVGLGAAHGEAPDDLGSAKAKVVFAGEEHLFIHPVCSVRPDRRDPDVASLRIDIFQRPPLEKHIENLRKWGNTSMMGSDFDDGRLPPHLVVILHVKEGGAELRADAIQFLGVSVTSISDPSLSHNGTGQRVVAPLIETMSGKLAEGETISGKIKGTFGKDDRVCSYEIEFSAKVVVDRRSSE